MHTRTFTVANPVYQQPRCERGRREASTLQFSQRHRLHWATEALCCQRQAESQSASENKLRKGELCIPPQSMHPHPILHWQCIPLPWPSTQTCLEKGAASPKRPFSHRPEVALLTHFIVSPYGKLRTFPHINYKGLETLLFAKAWASG